MTDKTSFDSALDAVEQLEPEAQSELITIVQRRLSERGRERIIQAVAEGRAEYARGECQPTTPEELIREALS